MKASRGIGKRQKEDHFFDSLQQASNGFPDMSRSSAQDGQDNLRSLQYAHGVASLFQAQSVSSSTASTLAGFHGLRFNELKAAAGISLPAGQAGVGSNQTCRRCGNLVIPGWTGSARLAKKEPGHEKKRKSSEGFQHSKNAMQWTCNCGWQTDFAGSDPGAKRKFKKARVSHDAKHAVTEQPASESISSASSPAVLVGKPVAAPVKPIETPFPATLSSAEKPVAKTATPPYIPAQTTKPQATKKKRTKKEGLQAMLQARKQSEDKDKKSGGAGGLGLSSFLQGL